MTNVRAKLHIDEVAESILTGFIVTLRSARKTAGLTQEEVASGMPVRGRAISEWECCTIQPKLENLIDWSGRLHHRFVILGQDGEPLRGPTIMRPGESWEHFERRRLASPLRNRRLALGLSQTDVGCLVGVSRDSIQRWELVCVPPRPIALVVWAQKLGYELALRPVSSQGRLAQREGSQWPPEAASRAVMAARRWQTPRRFAVPADLEALMFAMRPACPDDVPAVAAVITARSAWMEQRGLPSWREAVDDLAGQAAVDGTLMWVLTADEQVIGCTTLADDRPAWGWTPEQAAQDAFYLFTTCTHPEWRHAKPGSLIAWWAVDKAARDGKAFVRRGTVEASLMRYYATQGFELVHEVQRKNNLVYLMARRAQRLPEVERMFAAGAAGSAVLVS